jgi:hypothetical protein
MWLPWRLPSSEAASTDTGKNFIDPVGDYLKARKDSKD